MSRAGILALAAALVGGSAAGVWAQGAAPKAAEPPAHAEKPAAAPAPAPAPAAPAAGPQVQGEHHMEGRVAAVNHKTGELRLRTPEGTLRLHFPPAAIKEVKRGAHLDVTLAFVAGAAPAMAGEKTGAETGEHWMTGKISRISHHSGYIHLKAGDHWLVVHFPPPAIAHLKKGEEISVQLGYSTVPKKK